MLEIMGTNVSTTFISCPAEANATLGIKLPFLVMIIKNLKKYFSFEVQVLDDKNVRRRFRASNYQVRVDRLTHSPQFSLHSLARTGGLYGYVVEGKGVELWATPFRHTQTGVWLRQTTGLLTTRLWGVGLGVCQSIQSTTRVKPFICTMPMRLDEGWNQIQFNLSDFTRRAYGTNYIETLRVQIHANCRIRRIYFSDRLYSEEELPPEFKLFLPIQKNV